MSASTEKMLIANSVDELVQEGIKNIEKTGIKIWSTSGPALQSNNVTYVLENSYNRIHTLRAPTSVKYFARELYAYLCGSLKASDGLSSASKFWDKIADENGMINSNYGYYIFY